jgi:hypothetical protein
MVIKAAAHKKYSFPEGHQVKEVKSQLSGIYG